MAHIKKGVTAPGPLPLFPLIEWFAAVPGVRSSLLVAQQQQQNARTKICLAGEDLSDPQPGGVVVRGEGAADNGLADSPPISAPLRPSNDINLAVGAGAGIEASVQITIAEEPGQVIPGYSIIGSEIPADENIAVIVFSLHLQGVDGAVGAAPVKLLSRVKLEVRAAMKFRLACTG